MGGKPNTGTKPDKRLKENQPGRRSKPQPKAQPTQQPKKGSTK